MKQVICPNCSQKCIRHGVLKLVITAMVLQIM